MRQHSVLLKTQRYYIKKPKDIHNKLKSDNFKTKINYQNTDYYFSRYCNEDRNSRIVTVLNT